MNTTSEIRAGYLDARRTARPQLRDLRGGGWAYRLGFIAGWGL